jgi:hypothetical protein
MAITYKKNAQNVYKVPFYVQFWTWWALVLALAVLSLLLGLVVSIKFVQVVLWSLVAILTSWRAYSLTKSVIKAKTIGKYITQKKAEKYIIKLQEGLEVNLSERAHIAVWGRTGSKKTTVLFGIILQLFSMGADVRFIDGKDEFSSFKGFYTADKIVSDIDPVFEQLEDILAIIKQRQKIMANEVQKRQKIGLKASEVGLQPIVLIADEIGSIVALMDSKQSKKFVADLTAIIQRGRSVGVSVIASTQDPSTDTLPQKIRQQFATKVLLGSANSDIQRMAFGEVATTGNVEDFRGFYTCDGLTNQPLKFFVCDLYSYGFNELGTFKKAYNIGLRYL